VDGHSWTRRRACFWLLVRERAHERKEQKTLLLGLRALPAEFRRYLLGSAYLAREIFRIRFLIFVRIAHADSGSRGGVGGDARGGALHFA